jgi:hypothetical protein
MMCAVCTLQVGVVQGCMPIHPWLFVGLAVACTGSWYGRRMLRAGKSLLDPALPPQGLPSAA